MCRGDPLRSPGWAGARPCPYGMCRGDPLRSPGWGRRKAVPLRNRLRGPAECVGAIPCGRPDGGRRKAMPLRHLARQMEPDMKDRHSAQEAGS